MARQDRGNSLISTEIGQYTNTMTNRSNTAINHLQEDGESGDKVQRSTVVYYWYCKHGNRRWTFTPHHVCGERRTSGFPMTGRTDHLSDGSLRLGRGVNTAAKTQERISTSLQVHYILSGRQSPCTLVHSDSLFQSVVDSFPLSCSDCAPQTFLRSAYSAA